MSTFVILTTLGAAIFAAVTMMLQYNTVNALRVARRAHQPTNQETPGADQRQPSDEASNEHDLPRTPPNLSVALDRVEATLRDYTTSIAAPKGSDFVGSVYEDIGSMRIGLMPEDDEPRSTLHVSTGLVGVHMPPLPPGVYVRKADGSLVHRVTSEDGSFIDILLSESVASKIPTGEIRHDVRTRLYAEGAVEVVPRPSRGSQRRKPPSKEEG